jgi:hypothetical protein
MKRKTTFTPLTVLKKGACSITLPSRNCGCKRRTSRGVFGRNSIDRNEPAWGWDAISRPLHTRFSSDALPRDPASSCRKYGPVYQDDHWDAGRAKLGEKSNFVDVFFERFIDPVSQPSRVLKIETLQNSEFENSNWVQLQVGALACEGNSHHDKKGNDDASEHHPKQTRDPSDELEKR